MLFLTLPVSGVEIWIPGIVLAGLLVGFLIGLFGVGGGFLLTPALKVIFGIPYALAVGSSLAQVFVNSIVASFRHWRNGKIDIKLGLLLAAGATAGTEAGVRLLLLLKQGGTVVINGRSFALLDLVLSLLFIVLLVAMAIIVVLETSRKSLLQEVDTAVSRWLRAVRFKPLLSFPRSRLVSYSSWIPLILSIFAGVLTGLMGVGGGFIQFPLLIYVIGVPTHVAVGTSVFQVLIASGYGATRHALLGDVDFLLVVLLFAGSFAGVQLGVKASQVLGGRSIRRYFALVLAAGVGLVVWDLIRQILF